ncbi:MAG: minor capsid protein [Oscillospiraceae bacterium]|nr:minor capsid protein [Oscillospiraceae bacterium]
MAKSADYWKKRFEQLEKSAHSYGESAYREIEPAFDKAQREIQKEIEAWYGRLAKNNSISMQEARMLLSKSELEEFKWDVYEYIKYGKENAIDGQWIKELENASAKFHINRLEALKIRTQQAAEVAFGNELDSIDGMARKVFFESYYHTIYEVQKAFNVGWEIGQIDERKLSKIISKPWAADGRNFSDRIWQSKAQLVNELHTQLTRNCILGKGPDDAIKAISSKFGVSKSQAGRLVMTEEAFIHSAAQKEAFNELGVEYYKIIGTLDSTTCSVCGNLDSKELKMSDYQEGSTAPPFHPYCRCCTAPYFADMEGIGQRAARNADGKTYYVSSDMKYKDWKQKYVVDATSNADKAMYERYKSVLRDLSPESLEDFVQIKYNNSAEWEQLKYQYRTLNRYEIDGDVPAKKVIELDNAAYYAKKTGFDYSAFSGKEKRRIENDISNRGNAATMEFDGKIYFSHSRFGESGTLERSIYKGDYSAVTLSENRIFKVKDLGDGIPRQYDTETKFLEYVATQKQESDKFSVTILSEKHICESCQGVVQQFKEMFPNATINIVSGKKGYNGSEEGLKTWKRRKKVK